MRGRIARFASLLILFCSLLAPSVATHQASAAAALHYLYGSGSVTGGHRITLRVELTEPAPNSGIYVNLSANNAAVKVPSSIRVNRGETEREFTVATGGVAKDTNVTVTASYGVSRSRA
mgnify:CR=1 FL=1